MNYVFRDNRFVMKSRSYSSPIRQQQMEETRQRIVESALSLIAEHPGQTFSHEQVSQRAGIALRTVYRHFPAPDDLLDAVWQESDRRLQLSHYPETEQALIESIGPVYTRMDQNAAAMRGLLNSNAGREMRMRDNERRRSALEKAIGSATAHLDEKGKRIVLGAFQALYSGRTWEVMRDRALLREGEPALAVEWAMRTLLNQLHREQKALAREGKGHAEPHKDGEAPSAISKQPRARGAGKTLPSAQARGKGKRV